MITEYPVPTANSFPAGIAAGPDGNMWFTEANVSKVAKLAVAGLGCPRDEWGRGDHERRRGRDERGRASGGHCAEE